MTCPPQKTKREKKRRRETKSKSPCTLHTNMKETQVLSSDFRFIGGGHEEGGDGSRLVPVEDLVVRGAEGAVVRGFEGSQNSRMTD